MIDIPTLQEIASLISDIGILNAVVASLVLFVGSVSLGATGFGIGLVGTPGLLLVLEPQTAIVVLNTSATAVGIWIVLQARRDIPFREVLPIVIAGMLGVPFAVYILASINPTILRITISALLIPLAIMSITNFDRIVSYSDLSITLNLFGGRRLRVPLMMLLGVVLGFIVGALLPAFGVIGQLVMLFLLTRNWRRQSVRAAMAFFLLSLGMIAVIGYAFAGLYTAERLTLIAIVIPSGLLGLWLGFALLNRMNDRFFRYAIVSIIIITSLVMLGREFIILI